MEDKEKNINVYESNSDNEKYIKDIIENENIEVPESLRPENIGELLKKADSEKCNGWDITINENSVYGNSANENDISGKRKDSHAAKKSFKFRKRTLATVAAALVCLVGAGSAAYYVNLQNDKNNVSMSSDFRFESAPNTDMSYNDATDENAAAGGDGQQMGVDSYEEIYKLLKVNTPKKSLGDIIAGLFGMRSKGEDAVLTDEISYDMVPETTAAAEMAPTGAANTADSSVDGVNISSSSDNASATDTSSSLETGASTEEYSTTNIQELGVDEGDIIKTDGKYIYVLKNSWNDTRQALMIVEADGEKLTGMSDIALDIEGYEAHFSEMYVDGDTAVLIAQCYKTVYEEDDMMNTVTAMVTVDISDRANPNILSVKKQTGNYVSSRKNGEYLYTVSNYYVGSIPSSNKNKYQTYIPCVDTELVSVDNIYCPESFYKGYTVISSLCLTDNEIKDDLSVMLRSDQMYVSQNAIYFLRNDNTVVGTIEDTNKSSIQYGTVNSALVKFTYENGKIEYAGEAKVPGYTESQFSFSEKDGYIRVVTTMDVVKKYSNDTSYYYDSVQNGLYVFNDKLEMVGSVEGLGEDEYVKSVRYIGDMAYFVTFRQTDPLFAVDLSDPTNPVVVSELKMTGFSEYLHPYGDGKMIGLGYEADADTGRTQEIKLSMFDISEPENIVETDRYYIESVDAVAAMYNHKLILSSVSRNIFGFGERIWKYNQKTDAVEAYQLYELFTYVENDGFVPVISCKVDYDADEPVAVFIGDYIYIVDRSEYNFFIYSLKDYSYVGEWTWK